MVEGKNWLRLYEWVEAAEVWWKGKNFKLLTRISTVSLIVQSLLLQFHAQ